MYAHVNTARLSSSDEVNQEILDWQNTGRTISDQTARTIASWWHAPNARCRNITALSHGLPFDTEKLSEEVAREVADPANAEALSVWIDDLEEILIGENE